MRRCALASSAPEARVGCLKIEGHSQHHPRRRRACSQTEGRLLGRWEGCDALAQMAEVLGTNRKTQDLINHGREVGQGANDGERWSIGGARQTARGGQSQRVLHRLDGHAALVQLGREQTIRTTDSAARAGSGTVGFQKPVDIGALLHKFSLADRAANRR